MSKHLDKKRDLIPSETVLKIPKDGDCFFHCLRSVLPPKSVLEIRNDLADFILKNREKYQEFETDKTDYNVLRTLGAYASNEMDIAIRAAADFFNIVIEIHQELQAPIIFTTVESSGTVLKVFRTEGHFDLIVASSDYKKCHTCKNYLTALEFTCEDRMFSKCNSCREQARSKKVKGGCESCGIRASFNSIGESKARFCKAHAAPEMVNVVSKTCEFLECTSQPVFNSFGESKARFCKAHKAPEMVDVRSKRCEFLECTSHPSFNSIGESKARFCKAHSAPDMVDVRSKQCEFLQCTSQPSFNTIGESKGRFCKAHATPKMVDVKNKTCEFLGCTSLPTFNSIGESKARFCKTHAAHEMIDVKHKTCEFLECTSRPSFNSIGETKARFCKAHAALEMVDVRSKRCEFLECTSHPTFNSIGETKARFCKAHAAHEMVDVKHKTCEHLECKGTRACYGFCGQQVSSCAKHKTSQMFKNPTRPCADCKEQAEFGLNEPLHCLVHQQPNEISLISQACEGCHRVDILNKNRRCITFCEPEAQYQQLKQHEKAQENMVLKYLDAEISNELADESFFDFEDDKTIQNECKIMNRPDRMYDCKTHFVIVEVDEKQHKDKRSSCARGEAGELARMNNIQVAAGMSCIFLRFNPDNFRVAGVLQKVNMCERLTLLVKWLKACFKMVPEADLQPAKYKKLYFDEWDQTDVSFRTVNDLELV
jgi:hypothetical protein